jgi:hypothetical protein
MRVGRGLIVFPSCEYSTNLPVVLGWRFPSLTMKKYPCREQNTFPSWRKKNLFFVHNFLLYIYCKKCNRIPVFPYDLSSLRS